eukprot:TRINITY_DN8980_c0_g1_i2.p3 TRINITY_DN8980_c0_g1~~TRINITY_DN8980_c0_g1_i2.p3  ORF type:complete len:125 (+),score=47.38 TRINITY_DN8980_c0_g1_i2:168-542(+)
MQRGLVGSRCVQETGINAEYMGTQKSPSKLEALPTLSINSEVSAQDEKTNYAQSISAEATENPIAQPVTSSLEQRELEIIKKRQAAESLLQIKEKEIEEGLRKKLLDEQEAEVERLYNLSLIHI